MAAWLFAEGTDTWNKVLQLELHKKIRRKKPENLFNYKREEIEKTRES